MWKDIPNWEGLYQVNENGEIKSLKNGGKLVTGDINNAGYSRICLYHKPKKQRFFRHRLVVEMFIDNPNNYKEVNHIDGNKQNNTVTNLEWCDRTYNERDKRRNRGRDIDLYKPFKVFYLDGSTKNFEFAVDLAKELGITRKQAQNYVNGKFPNALKARGIQQIELI